MRRILLASAAALALSSALAATSTTTVTLSTTAYTDLGVGPMYLSAGGGGVIYQTADSGPPSTVTAGHSVLPGEEARFFQTTSHVWALASTSAARAIVSAGTGIAAAGGGGGGGGGPATVADGADIALGSLADAAYTSGSGTVVAILKAMNAKLGAALPLPTGAATLALQTTGNASLASILTNTPALGQAVSASSSPVVIASDQSAVPTALQASATGGASTTGNIAANNTTAVVLKNSPGKLYGAQLFGIGSIPAYVKFYDATSATCGSGTPVKRLAIPSASTPANLAGAVLSFGEHGVAFTTGITYCITTGITDADATAPAANTYIVNFDWK